MQLPEPRLRSQACLALRPASFLLASLVRFQILLYLPLVPFANELQPLPVRLAVACLPCPPSPVLRAPTACPPCPLPAVFLSRLPPVASRSRLLVSVPRAALARRPPTSPECPTWALPRATASPADPRPPSLRDTLRPPARTGDRLGLGKASFRLTGLKIPHGLVHFFGFLQRQHGRRRRRLGSAKNQVRWSTTGDT